MIKYLNTCQVRINGSVEKLSWKDSEEYFHKRPVENQIGAVVSRQSTVIPNRQVAMLCSLVELFKMVSTMVSN